MIATAPAARPCPEAARPWVLAATILGSSMAFIDGTIVNVALPALQRDLDATVADVQWVVEAYALLLSSLLLLGGALGDRVGRRRVYAAGIVLFAAASAGCGLAADVRQLVLARAAQGVGAALLVPGSLAIISAAFPEAERGRAIGTWSSASAIATVVGPVGGGWLIEHLSWRWAFLVNLPIALVVLVLLRRVPESRDPDAAGHLDWPGAALATVGLGGVVYALVESSRLGWHDVRVAAAFVAGVAGLVGFGAVEARSRHPLVTPALFRSRRFLGANLLTLFLYGALAVAFFYLPLLLVQVHGYSATEAGAAFLPFILIVSALSPWAGGLIDRLGPRRPLMAGPLIAAAGFALLAVPGSDGSYWRTFFPGLAVLGAGMGITVPGLTTTVMNAVDVRYAGIASGVNNAVSRTAGLLAIALLSVVVVAVFDRALDHRLPPDALPAAERAKLAGAEPPATADPVAGVAIRAAVADAFVTAFRALALVAAGLAVASALVAAATIDGAPGGAAVLRPATARSG